MYMYMSYLLALGGGPHCLDFYLYGDSPLSFKIHKIHCGTNIVFPSHLVNKKQKQNKIVSLPLAVQCT